MTKTPQPECPECEKLSNVSEKSQELGNFIDWLRNDRGIVLAEYIERRTDDEILLPSHHGDSGINRLLAEYFEIDLEKVENERRALLDWIREKQK